MTDPNRLAYDGTAEDATYWSASEGRGEGPGYVPDIWHAVELVEGAPLERAACGAYYDADKLERELAFADRPEAQKCGGCLSRVGSPMAFRTP